MKRTLLVALALLPSVALAQADASMTYLARAENPATGATVDAVFLAKLKERTAEPIYYGDPDSQLAFPGFSNPDRIVVYEQKSKKLVIIDRTRVIP